VDPGIKYNPVYDFSNNPNVTVITASSARSSGSSTASTTTASYQTTNTGAPAAAELNGRGWLQLVRHERVHSP
jgi:hypothetical protein